MTEIIVTTADALEALFKKYATAVVAELKPEPQIIEPEDEKMWLVEDVMHYTGYSQNTVYRKKGLFGAQCVGHKLLFKPSQVKAVLEKNGYRPRPN